MLSGYGPSSCATNDVSKEALDGLDVHLPWQTYVLNSSAAYKKTHTPYLSPARYWRVVPYHKRRQQECGEQKSMWINHCWLRFVLEHIPRYSSTQAHHHCPIHYFVQKCFNDHFLMAFMFIYVRLKFQYSSMKIERSMILWPQILTFFLVSKEVDHRIIHERPEEASNCKAPFQHLRLRPGYVDMAVSCHGWV